MTEDNRSILDNPEALEYGSIYVISDLYTPQELLDDYRSVMGHVTGQSDALNRFSIQVYYEDHAPMLVARRFNAGNIGRTALLTCPVCGDINIDSKLAEVFFQNLFDFGQLDTGDCHIEIKNLLSRQERVRMQDSIDHPDLGLKLENARALATAKIGESLTDTDDLHDEEGKALVNAENQRAQYLAIIGQLVLNYISLTHSDPKPLLGDSLSTASPLIFSSQELSPLVIDNDLRLRLSLYQDAEIRLHPLSKALYILFLRHPEGIELRNIDQHRDELEQIYDIIMPGRDIDAGQDIIDNVVNPLSGTLLQNLSRIKRFFKTVIMDDELAANYYITGRRGEAYSISLSRNLVRLPRIFKTIG